MIKITEQTWTRACLAVFVSIGVLCILILLDRLPGWDQKTPEWVAALGTIAAFAGTITIATTEARRRHHNEMALARLRAVGMLFRVRRASKAISNLRSDLHAAMFFSEDSRSILTLSDHLAGLQLWELDEIEALIPLPRNIAARLAQSADEIASVKKDFEHARNGDVLRGEGDRQEFLNEILATLDRTGENLRICLEECTQAKEHFFKHEADFNDLTESDS